MKVDPILCTTICENCYVVSGKRESECILIDPGAYEPVQVYLGKTGLKPVAILLTHGHFDHIGGAKRLKEEYGIPVCIHALDADKLSNNKKNLSVISVPLRLLEPFDADVLLEDHQKLAYGGFSVEVLFTPGHSCGGVSYYFADEKAVFCGDTLFRGSYGRYDFYDSSIDALCASLTETLFALPEDCIAYPGHGDPTEIGFERDHNFINRYGRSGK